MIAFYAIGALVLVLVVAKADSPARSIASAGGTTNSTPTGGSIVKLPDVSASVQGGKWSKDYDGVFENVCSETGVPFALLKAHAIRESALDEMAFRQEPSGKASYGLMQILWWKGSDRFRKYGYSDDFINAGDALYDPYINVSIAAQIILDNWNRMDTLRDTINAYNTGVKEKTRIAPGNYVADVIKNYSALVGRSIV